MSERKKIVYHKPIGMVLQPYMSDGTGEHVPHIIGMKGLLDTHDATTINVYGCYGIPLLVVHAPRRHE